MSSVISVKTHSLPANNKKWGINLFDADYYENEISTVYIGREVFEFSKSKSLIFPSISALACKNTPRPLLNSYSNLELVASNCPGDHDVLLVR